MECRVYLILLYLTLVAGNPCSDRALGSQPYPPDCRAYIVCWMTVPYLNTCPDDQLYDVQTNSCQPTHLSVCCNITFPTTFSSPLSPNNSGLPNISTISPIKTTNRTLSSFSTTTSSLPSIMNSFKPTATLNKSVEITESVTTLAPVKPSTEIETVTTEISASKIPSLPPITESITENIITESSLVTKSVTETSGPVNNTPFLTTIGSITATVVSSAQEMTTCDKITPSIMVNTNPIPTISSPKLNILNTETTMEHGKTLQTITKPPLPVSTSISTETITIPTTYQEPSKLVTITPVQTISSTYKSVTNRANMELISTTLEPITSTEPVTKFKMSASPSITTERTETNITSTDKFISATSKPVTNAGPVTTTEFTTASILSTKPPLPTINPIISYSTSMMPEVTTTEHTDMTTQISTNTAKLAPHSSKTLKHKTSETSSPPYPTFFSLPSVTYLPPEPTLPPASSNPASTTRSPLSTPISRPDDKSLCPDPNSCSFYFKCVFGSTRKTKCIYGYQLTP